jgi:hypothetical protein
MGPSCWIGLLHSTRATRDRAGRLSPWLSSSPVHPKSIILRESLPCGAHDQGGLRPGLLRHPCRLLGVGFNINGENLARILILSSVCLGEVDSACGGGGHKTRRDLLPRLSDSLVEPSSFPVANCEEETPPPWKLCSVIVRGASSGQWASSKHVDDHWGTH